jgi:hypothetical protein
MNSRLSTQPPVAVGSRRGAFVLSDRVNSAGPAIVIPKGFRRMPSGHNPGAKLVLQGLSKTDFEKLMAEIFARMGFHVDLYRPAKDDGIDFLAIDIGQNTPVIKAVQCKHPDIPTTGNKARTLPVTTVREIYGVAKANDLNGAIAVTSSTYSPEAKKFADLKPEEIQVSNAEDISKWIMKYRWNKDE